MRRRYRHDISQPEVLARLRPFLVTQRNQHLRKTSRDHFTAEEIKAWEDADPLTWNERIARLCCPAQQNLDESEVKVVPKNVWLFFQDLQCTPSQRFHRKQHMISIFFNFFYFLFVVISKRILHIQHHPSFSCFPPNLRIEDLQVSILIEVDCKLQLSKELENQKERKDHDDFFDHKKK